MKQIKKALVVVLALLTTPLFAQNYTIKSDKDLGAPLIVTKHTLGQSR